MTTHTTHPRHRAASPRASVQQLKDRLTHGATSASAALNRLAVEFDTSVDDPHRTALGVVVRGEAARWVSRKPADVTAPTIFGPQDQFDVAPPFLSIPTTDEHGDRLSVSESTAAWALEKLPFVDIDAPWPSRTDALSLIETEYRRILPPVLVDWEDVGSDRTLSLVVFQGLGAHRVHRRTHPNKDHDFEVDLTWMQAFPVRPGYERYGAAAFFDAQFHPTRIYLPGTGTTVSPGEPGWKHAKWVFRTSLFVAATVTDHLGSTHFLASNVLATATTEALETDHPLRRLIAPFVYGTVDINREAHLTLSNLNGLAHRTFAFTHEGLTRCLLKGVESARLQPFPDSIAEAGMDVVREMFPYAQDGLDLWSIIEKYVESYLDVYYPRGDVIDDVSIRRWWHTLIRVAPNMELGALMRPEQLVQTLTHLMFTVTGFHAHVGDVVAYTHDPDFVGARLRDTATRSDVQPTIQLLNLTVSTAFEQPPMIGDYSHLLLTDRHEDARRVFDQYQNNLTALAETIGLRNQERTQPFETFNPAHLDSSVST